MNEFTPSVDASLGLVYRLNTLWNRCDYASVEGNYDKWDNILDAIYRNLLFKDDLEIQEGEDKQIERVSLSQKDVKIYNYVSKRVHQAKRNWIISKSKGVSISKKYRSKYFHALQLKDISIRKMMQGLRIYFKEFETSPGTATFGSFGKGKK